MNYNYLASFFKIKSPEITILESIYFLTKYSGGEGGGGVWWGYKCENTQMLIQKGKMAGIQAQTQEQVS